MGNWSVATEIAILPDIIHYWLKHLKIDLGLGKKWRVGALHSILFP